MKTFITIEIESGSDGLSCGDCALLIRNLPQPACRIFDIANGRLTGFRKQAGDKTFRSDSCINAEHNKKLKSAAFRHK